LQHPVIDRKHSQTLDNQTISERGLDNLATVFSNKAARWLPRLAGGSLTELDDGPELDVEKARLMARLTSVAYCSDTEVIQSWQCTRCKRVPTFQPHEVVFDKVWDVLAYVGYDPSWRAVVVVFRGTDSSNWGNWINNLKTWRANHMYPIPEAPKALVHAGFYSLYTNSALQANVTRAARELVAAHPGTTRLHVTGHSMGGALSALCALDLKFNVGFTDVRSWSFGSPRVGNWQWEQLYAAHVTESWRFTHNRDVVPSLPPQLIGFHHVAREAWLVDVETVGGVDQKVLICDASGEDPSCHNSACMLGMCTSVADHLMYLEIPMYKDMMEC